MFSRVAGCVVGWSSSFAVVWRLVPSLPRASTTFSPPRVAGGRRLGVLPCGVCLAPVGGAIPCDLPLLVPCPPARRLDVRLSPPMESPLDVRRAGSARGGASSVPPSDKQPPPRPLGPATGGVGGGRGLVCVSSRQGLVRAISHWTSSRSAASDTALAGASLAVGCFCCLAGRMGAGGVAAG